MSFKEKYLKYKNKYLELKKQFGGCKICNKPNCIEGELCENVSNPAAIELSSRFEDFLESNGKYVLPFLQYPEGCALGAVGPVTMAMATTVRRWDWLPFSVGTEGKGDGQFFGPRGIAFSSDKIYVCDTQNNRIQVFDRFGNYLHKWGSAHGQFNKPNSVAISSSDEVYVCDTFNYCIQVFDLSGNYSGQWDSKGNLNLPSDVTIHGDQVFVSDTYNHRIQVFDLSGNYSGQWGNKGSKPGEFNYPNGLAVSSAGDVVVCDPNNNRIQVFDLKGTFKYSYGDSSPHPKANWEPRDVAISSKNEVFISDSRNDRVLVFNINGTFIRYVHLPAGRYPFKPTGIAISPSGLLVISDTYNHRIYIMPHGA
jgi:tripartite motif-containing protein 71